MDLLVFGFWFFPLAWDNLPGLVSNLTSNPINKFERKIVKRSCQSRERVYFIYLNKDMDDIIKIIKSLEDSGVVIDGVTEIVKNEIKQQKGGFLPALLAL